MVSKDVALVSEQADAFQAGNPQARVVRIANANHFVFRSNEADVLREMNGFIANVEGDEQLAACSQNAVQLAERHEHFVRERFRPNVETRAIVSFETGKV